MNSIGILWAQYGPYHFARIAALKKHAGSIAVHAMELADRTSDYAWSRPTREAELITLCPGALAEELSFREVYLRARRAFSKLKLDVCILPSYAPKQSLAALLAAKSLGIRTVMMNESHAGTARALGMKALVKRQLVRLFDAALIGGNPQKRYFAALGMPPEKIFTGYDAVDNDYFASRADQVRANADQFRARYNLPSRYFLSLGRFVPKKNLATLIRAYWKLMSSNPNCATHLVMVGSGEQETALRTLCVNLRLPVYEKSEPNQGGVSADDLPPGVHFYGFRQIDENPIFYALADAFILPSLYEEWGLVVNEAMASGLPVVVSDTVGCAEDLLKHGKISLSAHIPNEVRERVAHLAGCVRRNGFVFNPQSVQSLANALMVLDSAEEIRDAMGRAGREIVEQFSCENFAHNALLAAQAAVRGNTAERSDAKAATKIFSNQLSSGPVEAKSHATVAKAAKALVKG